jgi:hypothetical protein
LRKLLQLALLLACVASHAQVDRNAFTFTRYDLQIEVTPADSSLNAKGAIALRNDSPAAQRHVALQISSTLEWKKISVAGKPAQFLSQPYTSDIDHTGALSEAIVTLPDTAPGATVELQIEYSGTVPRDATRLTRIGVPEARALTADWDTISDTFTAVRGVGYVCWYPVSIEAASLSSGTDVFDAIGAWKRREAGARMRIGLTAMSKENLPGTASDRVADIRANDNPPPGTAGAGSGGSPNARRGGRELVYEPVGSAVPTFAVGMFRDSAESQSGTTVSYLPGHASAAADYARVAASVAPSVAQWFGPRKRNVHIVELADANAAAYDAANVLFTPLRTVDRKSLDLVLAHQFTHATFESPRPWMYEGLATFAEALQRERQDGRAGALEFLASKMPLLAAVEKSHAPPPTAAATNAGAANSLINSSDEVMYRTKAMYAWWMLRDMIGDSALQHALADYRAAADTQPAYMQQLLEAGSKKQLEWFFDDWVYRDRGLPDFKVDAAFPRPSLAGTWGVTVTVENLGGAGAEVPVTVHAKEGERSARVLVAAHAKAVVRIVVPTEPVDVTVNDGSVPESNRDNNTLRIEIPRRP